MNTSLRISPDSRFERCPDVVSDQVGEEAVLISPKQARVRMLNETGSLIWRLSDGSKTLREIAEAVASEYDTTVEECLADVAAFVEELVAAGVMEKV